MPAKEYFISGMGKWCKVYKPDTKFEPQYSVQLFPDDDGWDVWEEMRLGGKPKEDEDGKYVTFRRKLATSWSNDIGPPEVVDSKGQPFKELIGNGSTITCKVEVYDTPKGPGHRLLAVRVDKWVKYEAPSAPEETEASTKKPAAGAKPKGLPF